MPYLVKHKSPDVCLVKYVRGKKSLQTKLLLNERFIHAALLLGVLFVFLMAVAMQPPIVFSLILFIVIYIASITWELLKPVHHPLPQFEIELNRAKGLVSIIDSESPNQDPITYSLGIFRGFDVRETALRRKSKTLFQAELLLKIEPAKGLVRDIRIRKGRYIVSTNNAADIIKSTNKWLKLADEKANAAKINKTKKKVKDKEENVVRDFRDME